MTDPAFLAFFAGPFQDALRRVEIPGVETASWDRKAAWLLWLATDEGRSPLPVASDLAADVAPPEDIFS